MNRLLLTLGLIIALCPLFQGNAYAEAPNLLTYQGRLKEAGQAVTGNRSVEILLCDDETAGTCHTSGAQPVAVSNGLFRSTFAIPGSANFGIGSWWLEIKIGADTLAPRERLTSNAYAMFAATAAYASNISAADGSNGVSVSSNLFVSGNIFSVGGSTFVVAGGRVGFGTNTPNSAFHVLVTDDSALNFANYSGNLVFNTVSKNYSKTVINNNSSGEISFSVDGNEIMVVSTPTRVGIGTDSPAFRLHVSSGAGESGVIMAISTGTSDVIRMTGAGEVYANKYYGDGSSLSGLAGMVNPAIVDLDMSGFDIVSVSSISVSSITVASGPGVSVSTHLYVNGNIYGNGSQLSGITATSYSGTLPVTNGGTGATTLTGVLKGNGTGAFTPMTGTANKITRWSNASTLADSSFLGESAAGVGVGTASPDQKLTVAGNISQTGVIISSGTGDNYFAGRVGIGTTGPSAGLHVVGSGLLFTGTVGSIPATGLGTRLMWYPAKSAFRAGYTGGDSWDDANIGAYSFAGGDNTQASGFASTAFGYTAYATGTDAVAIGADLTASGDFTVALGQFVTAAAARNMVIGQGVSNGSRLINNRTDSLMIGFNRTVPTFTVFQSSVAVDGMVYASSLTAYGDVGIGTASPGYKLDVQGGSVNASAGLCIGGSCIASWAGAGDNLGSHNAGQDLQMNWNNIYTVSSITAAGHITAAAYQVNGSTVLAILPGSDSLGVGVNAGNGNSGDYNTFVGYNSGGAGLLSGNHNVFVGYSAGVQNLTGYENSFLGAFVGANNNRGTGNAVAGYKAFFSNTTGSGNSILGSEAGYGGIYSSATLVGYKAGYALTSGSDNILLGFQAGDNLETGSRNIIIGYDLDATAATISNEIRIGNIIFGNMNTGGVAIGANNTLPVAALDVKSTGTASNVYAQVWRDGGGAVISSMTSTGLLAVSSMTASGRVGAGTMTPRSALDVWGGSLYLGQTGAVHGYINADDALYINIDANNDDPNNLTFLQIGHNSTAGGSPLLYVGEAGIVGIGTSAPTAALDVKSTGTAANVYGQIWRDSGGNIVSSVSAAGSMMASEFVGDGSKLSGIGVVPIGAILAWAKSLAGVPTLPDNYVECNGQTIADAESPLNGQTVPNLNGNNNVLAGASTSGTVVDKNTKAWADGNDTTNVGITLAEAGHTTNSYSGSGNYPSGFVIRLETYQVVWIMRIR